MWAMIRQALPANEKRDKNLAYASGYEQARLGGEVCTLRSVRPAGSTFCILVPSNCLVYSTAFIGIHRPWYIWFASFYPPDYSY